MASKVNWWRKAWWVVTHHQGRRTVKRIGPTKADKKQAEAIKKKIMSIKTDSTPVEEPKDPEKCNVYALLKLFASEEERTEIEGRYREGGIGYGEVKKRLHEQVVERFKAARERRTELMQDPGVVQAALARGVDKARASAADVMRAVRSAVGMQHS